MAKRKKKAAVSGKVAIAPSAKRFEFACGIYEILHEETKRRYVGSSFEVEKRLYLHAVSLRTGRHHCKYLQNVYNKHGAEGFTFYLLETCDRDSLAEREQFHMDADSEYSLMNAQPNARTAYGFRHSEETRKKMAVIAKITANTKAQKKMRKERALKQHREGRIGVRKILNRPRVCANCKLDFVPPRVPAGYRSATKWCDDCRPPHRGGRYKTASKLKGEAEQYHKPGRGPGWKHTEEVKKQISKAAKRMWKRIKYSRVVNQEGKSPKQKYPGRK